VDSTWRKRSGPTTGLGRALLSMLSLALGAATPIAYAQTVQLPYNGVATPEWGSPAVTPMPQPSLGVPAPSFNPYVPSQGTPVFGSPVSPYGSPMGPPPTTSLPYTVAPQAPLSPAWGAPPAPASLATPSSAGNFGEGNAMGWQSGVYGFQQPDGSTTTWRQLLARLRFEHTLLLADNATDSFALNRSEVASTLAIPINGSVETPIFVTPGFAFNWFDGPVADPAAIPRGPDMPPRTYDAYLDLAWNPQFTPQFGAELGFRTGVWTDFEEVNEDSLRLLGRGLGVVSISPQMDFLLGAVYLDRVRTKLLPAGGVRWRPSPEWDLYLVFPNPKIRRSWFSSGTADWWWYVAGEYGGGSWTVERENLGDRVDYNDIRAILGVEWQTPRQATGHLEIGYVFDRELVFESQNPYSANMDDAIMFRAGIGY
jgi:hypothetical protein